MPLKLSKTTKKITMIIRDRAWRLTIKIVNVDGGKINILLRLNFDTAKSLLHNFWDKYICGTEYIFCTFLWRIG